MKNLKHLVLAILMFACGAPADEIVIGSAEQEYVALNSPTKQFGSKTGGFNASCDKTSTGQVCSVPRFKRIEIVRDDTGTWTEAHVVGMQTVRGAAIDRHPGWTFNTIDNLTDPADPNAVRVFVLKNTVSGASNSNVDLYRTVSFGGVTNLTEGGGGGLPVGQYQSHSSCTVTIDQTKIDNKGASTLEDNRLFNHAFGSALSVCMGIGMNASNNGQWTQRTINLAAFLSAGTSGEACRANFGDLTDTADFSIQTASVCPSD